MTSRKQKPPLDDIQTPIEPEPEVQEEVQSKEPPKRFIVLVPDAVMEATGQKYVVFRESIAHVAEDPEELSKPAEDRKPRKPQPIGKTELWLFPAEGFDPDSDVALTQPHSGINAETVVLGGYEHFKGGRYRVMGEAVLFGAPLIEYTESVEVEEEVDGEKVKVMRDVTKTKEPRYVVYRKEDSTEVWLRTIDNFKEIIPGNAGNSRPRFRRIPT